MITYHSRLWLGFGLSFLAAGAFAPASAAPACQSAAPALLGEGAENGEVEGGPPSPVARAQILDRMAAQIEGALAARAAGDAESAEILVAAATDEGPARLARR